MCLWAGYPDKKCDFNVADQHCWLSYTVLHWACSSHNFNSQAYTCFIYMSFANTSTPIFIETVTSRCITLFATSRYMIMLTVLISLLALDLMVLQRVYVAACPSYLIHSLLVEDNICFFSAIPPPPLTVAHRSFTYHSWLNCSSVRIFLLSVLLHNTASSHPSHISLVWIFSSYSFFSSSINLILPAARQIISCI